MAKVKICGLKEPVALRAAVEAGADWVGFVFVEKSPRCVSLSAAQELLRQTGESEPVALLVDPGDDLIDQVCALGFETLQLHGAETVDRLVDIKRRTGAEVWKAIGVATQTDLARAARFDVADRLLVDARPPKGAVRTGGHGRRFDWSILDGWTSPRPWLLAGGLSPDNAAEAIAATNAPALDVSSGVEAAPGVKDAALIRSFIEAARG